MWEVSAWLKCKIGLVLMIGEFVTDQKEWNVIWKTDTLEHYAFTLRSSFVHFSFLRGVQSRVKYF